MKRRKQSTGIIGSSPTAEQSAQRRSGELVRAHGASGQPRELLPAWVSRAAGNRPGMAGSRVAPALFTVAAFVAAGATSVWVSTDREPDGVQPIEFNHKAHIDAEIECLQCHEGLLDSSASILPTLETCTGCHYEDPPDDKPELAKLAGFAEREEELVWDPMLRLPDHVFFPHGTHVVAAEIECTDCHADMPERTQPPDRRRIVTMSDCIACHEDHPDREAARRAAVDCASCHR